MYHLPRVFGNRKNTKSMDRQSYPTRSSSSSPSSRPRLNRTKARKNFEFTPSSSVLSSSSPSSTTSTSSAPRIPYLNLNNSSDRSLRIEGDDDQLDLVFQRLGISPEDLEIPRAAWEVYRKSPDVSSYKSSQLDFDEPQKPSQPEAHEVQLPFDGTANDFPGAVQASQVLEYVTVESEKHVCLNGDTGGKGLKGDRPPFLIPPPSISVPRLDSACSTCKGLAPHGNEDPQFSPFRRSFSSDDEDDGRICYPGDTAGVMLDATIHQSGSSFTSSHDDNDDLSSTTTDRASVSPNGRHRVGITNWQKGKCLGKGSFGTVYEGYTSDGMFFAIKEVSLLEPGSRSSILSLEKEIEILSKLEHENIVKYLGTDKDESNLYIFLELVTKGSLANIYKIYALEDSQVSAYTRQILLGLKYLHDKDIVHRDIKCANILVVADGTVKLADFGLAKASKLNDLKSSQGTPAWMAPEVVDYRKTQGYGTSADIWSLGCTVLEMLTGQLPYHPLDRIQVTYRIGNGEPPPVPENLSNDSRDFILKCLQVKPSARPSADELLHHPFVKRSLPTSDGSAESPILGRGRLRYS